MHEFCLNLDTGSKRVGGRSDYRADRHRSNSLNTSTSEFGDQRALSFGDLQELGSDYEVG